MIRRTRLCLAVIGLAAFIAGAFWVDRSNTARRMAAEAESTAAVLHERTATLRRQIRALSSAPPVAAPPDHAAFLRQLHETAARRGLHIRRLSPRPQEPGGLELTLAGPFPSLLLFVLDTELLGAGLREFQAAPGGESGAARLDITLLLSPPTRGPVAGAHAASVAAAIAAGPRNPFEPRSAPGPAEEDLTRHHRLTGLTTAGAARFATIDGQDYAPGDTLQDMTVTALRDDAVLLTRGTGHFIIRFPRPGG